MVICLAQEVKAATIWSENFETYSDNDGDNGSGGANNNTANPNIDWTNTNGGSDDWFRVESTGLTPINGNYSFGGNETDGIVTWETELIDISAYTNIEVSMQYDEEGNMNGNGEDWISIEYQLDGGAWTIFGNGFENNDMGTAETASTSGLFGSTISLRVRMMSDDDDETWMFDDVLVTGDLAGPVCNPCYSVANGNFDASSTWSNVSGGASGFNALNNGTVDFYIEGGYTVNMNVSFNVHDVTVGLAGNGMLIWTADNVQLTINNGGALTVNNGSAVDENGYTNSDIVFASGGFSYDLVSNDLTNGLKIDNVYLQDDVELSISGSGLLDVSNNFQFIGSRSFANNLISGSFMIRNNLQWGDADTDSDNRFDNNGSVMILNDVYFVLQTDDDSLFNNGAMNIVGDVIWPDDGMTGAAANVDGYIENNGSMTIGDDLYFGADDCKIINNGTLSIVDDIFHFEHTDLTGITTTIGANTAVGGKVYYQVDLNASTSNYITNDGIFSVGESIESYQGNIIITNQTNGVFTVNGDIYQDHSGLAMTISNDGVMILTDDLRLQDANSGMGVTNSGTLTYDQVEASNGDLDITNNGTINQVNEFLVGEIDGSSTFINGPNARWNYGGVLSDPDTYMDCRAVGNVFNYNRGGSQTMIDVVTDDYYHLEVTVSGTKTSVDDIDIEGNLTISGAAFLDVDAGNDNIEIAGNWINTSNGGFIEGTETVTFDGVGLQSVTCSTIGEETFHYLNIQKNAADEVVLNNNAAITATGILNFIGTNGYLRLNTNDFTINSWSSGDLNGFDENEFIIVDIIGFIKYNGVSNGEIVVIPMGVGTGFTNYALAELTMTDAGSGTLDVNACDEVQLDGGICDGVALTDDFVGITWNFVSTSTNAIVKLYFDAFQALSGLSLINCSVVHYGSAWEQLSAFGLATLESATLWSRTGVTTSFSPFSVGGVDAPLPVELIDFTAKMINRSVELNWTTAVEIDNHYFEVEKSNDGIMFESVGIIMGAGNSSIEISYSMKDVSPFVGVSYYRLKQVDYSGKISYSAVKEVSVDKAIEATVFPNPVTAYEFYLSMLGEKYEEVLLVLYDPNGVEVFSKLIVSQEGGVLIAIDISKNLQSGVYIIVGTSKNEVFRKKILVLSDYK